VFRACGECKVGMKILLVSHILGGFAGDSGQMWHTANGLINAGHEVDIFTTDGNPWFFDESKKESYEKIRKKLLEANGKGVKIKNVKVYTVSCTSTKLGMYSRNTVKFARENIKKYDIVYAIHWYNHPVMTFAKIAHEKGVPFILAAYGSLQEPARSLNSRGKKILDFLYTKNLIKNTPGFHSVGELETEQYVKLGIKKEKIYHVDHGLVLEDFIIKNRSNIFERININPQKDRYIIFVGRIDKKKGVDILINSFANIEKNFDDVSLVIVGTGLADYENELKDLVSKLNLQKVIFTGFVSENEKLELLELATSFITISHSDVHTIAAQEAMAMGVPIILSKASDWPEIDEYNAGMTIDIDVKSVEIAIKKMLNDENLSTYGENAKRLIKDRFLIESLIPKYEKMFKDVIEKFEKMN
jgi:glycosyltransferase involved in cell wall biosynthesis